MLHTKCYMNNMDNRTIKRKTGDWGEERATTFLAAHGYKIVERNYLTRAGELDIIAWHHKPHFGKTLCFIEVKTRAANDGSAERATQGKKLERIFRAARHYCLSQSLSVERTPMQFEQVSIYADPELMDPIVRHFVIPVE